MSTARSWKLLEILEETTRFFSDREVPDARLQAELLLADVLGLKRLDLYLQFDRPLHVEEVDRYRDFVRQRLRRVPLQYIIGTAAFRHLELSVTPEVLIPRPETEILVDIALEKIADLSAPRCLDMCCGSGAIALSLAYENTLAQVVGSDVSETALAVAARNAELCGLANRVEWLSGDLFGSVTERLFELIACNPPYVRHADIASLQPEVQQFEPHLALDGGEDGLDFYRRIAQDSASFLSTGGYLLLEVGDGQAEQVAQLLQDAALYSGVDVQADLNDIPRIVIAQKTAETDHG
jgi:release factor glutamine methyltransferase